jgi:hypothetical protein
MQTKNKSAKMHILLRALVLIDHTERDVSQTTIGVQQIDDSWDNQAATLLKMRQKYNFDFVTGPKVQPALKRKNCYYNKDFEEEEATRSMHRMRIDSAGAE